MGAFAWYYNAGQGTYYWTEAYNMSASNFAQKVSVLVKQPISAADTSSATKSNFEAMKKRATNTIHID